MKQSVRKIIVLLLCAVLLTGVFAGCGNSGKTETPQTDTPKTDTPKTDTPKTDTPKADTPAPPAATPGTEAPPPEDDEYVVLKVGVSSYLGGFITGGMKLAESSHACDAVFNPVWYVEPSTYEIKSDILTDWYWEDDTTLICKMRDDVVFSNGDKATAEDLLYSFTSLTERGAFLWVANMHLIPEECELRDTYTCALKVTSKDELLFTAVTYLYDKSWAESVGWESLEWFQPVGSGPYYVAEYEPEHRMVLKLRDEYWERPVSDFYVDEYEITYFANPTTMYMAMEIGDIDINCTIGESDYKRFLNEGGEDFTIVGKPTGVVSHFDFGYICNDCWYDKRVRQAVAYGVPWDEFGELSYGVMYYPATSFATHDSALYENVGRYEYDLEKAKALLAEAGYGPGECKIQTYMQDHPGTITQGEALKFYLEEIGFATDFTFTSTWGQKLQTTEIEFGTHFNARGSGTRNPTASLNMAGLRSLPFLYIDDAKFQELYVPLAQSFDQPASERMALAKELQHYVYDECLVIPIAETQTLIGFRTKYLSGQQVLDCTLTSNNVYLSKLALKDNYMK